MMYVVLECCVHNITCKCVFSWVCGCSLHPKFKGKVIREGIVSVNHASKGSRKNFARLCGFSRQMVMVTRVYKPNFKLMVEKLERT